MKGYAYLDLDRNIGVRSAEYVETENPQFFQQNSHLIVRMWKFDTEDISSMQNLLMGLKDLKILGSNIYEFCESVGFRPKEQRDVDKV